MPKSFLTACAVVVWLHAAVAAPSAPAARLRCGWFDNPTPANAWLHDRDGEWTVSIQGGHQADGDWPAFKASQWVNTNVHYGHGCACLKVEADAKTHEVNRILSARARPLGTCRADHALREPA